MATNAVIDKVKGKKTMRGLKFSFVKPVEIYKVRVSEIEFVKGG